MANLKKVKISSTTTQTTTRANLEKISNYCQNLSSDSDINLSVSVSGIYDSDLTKIQNKFPNCNISYTNLYTKFNNNIVTSVLSNETNRGTFCMEDPDNAGNYLVLKNKIESISTFGTYFSYNTELTEFNELNKFTNITSLGSSCFRGCTNLTSINIPEGITYLNTFCFSGDKNLVNVNIPSTVTTIDNDCFQSCSSADFSSADFQNLVTIGSECFYGAGKFPYYINLNSIVTIKNTAFYSGKSTPGIIDFGPNLTNAGVNLCYNWPMCILRSTVSTKLTDASLTNLSNRFWRIYVPDNLISEYTARNSTFGGRCRGFSYLSASLPDDDSSLDEYDITTRRYVKIN